MELVIPFVCIGNSLSVVSISGKPKTKSTVLSSDSGYVFIMSHITSAADTLHQ